jgi:hypothetical protein
MGADAHRPEDLCAGADIHVSFNCRNTMAATPDCDLLEDQAIHSDRCVTMDHDPVRMRNQQPTSDLTVERDIYAADDGPEAMAQDEPLAKA